MTIGTFIGGFVAFALLIMGLTAVSNFLFFPRLRPTASPTPAPFVSILVPARNEAAVIGQTVQRLLTQRYSRFELLVLDDNSADETAVYAQQAATSSPHFRLLNGRLLPPGWLGKNWACHQLAQAAQGEILLFTDADVGWQPGALAALVAAMTQTQADMLTVWPTQQSESWGERLTVPLLALVILAYLPILPVHHTSWPAFATANGQCLAFRRAAYDQMGGHTAVRNHVLEDVALARQLKKSGLRLRMADGNRLLTCRMYTSWPEVQAGFAKNILVGHGNSGLFLLVSTLFHWLLFLFPWLWLLLGGGWWALALALAGIGLRLATAVFTRQRPFDALLMPLSVLLMTRIAAQSLWWRWRGQGSWKGRALIDHQ